jgi:hypothetical protein
MTATADLPYKETTDSPGRVYRVIEPPQQLMGATVFARRHPTADKRLRRAGQCGPHYHPHGQQRS